MQGGSAFQRLRKLEAAIALAAGDNSKARNEADMVAHIAHLETLSTEELDALMAEHTGKWRAANPGLLAEMAAMTAEQLTAAYHKEIKASQEAAGRA